MVGKGKAQAKLILFIFKPRVSNVLSIYSNRKVDYF